MIDSKDLFNIKLNKETTSSFDVLDMLLENQDIRKFILDNEITQRESELAINIFLEYINDLVIKSDGTKESKSLKGFMPVLSYDNKQISLKHKSLKPITKLDRNLKLFNLPLSLKEANFEDFNLTSMDRKKAYSYAKRFVDTFMIPMGIKGLYLSGEFRSGKTYLASVIANEIASKGYKVIEVYYPELSSRLKGMISGDYSGSFNDTVEELKCCDLLVLDDFCGENLNPLVRDEALGTVLNYRLTKGLPVIITANPPMEKLYGILRKDNSENESLKAKRIIERIKELTTEFLLFDRYDKKGEYSNEN